MTVAAIVLTYLTLFVFAEVAKRKLHWRAETTRWWLHITTGAVSVLLPIFVSRTEIIGLAASFTFALLISRWRNILSSIHGVQRAGWGELFFPIGIGIAAWWWLPGNSNGYTYALLVMTFADALANITGQFITGRKIIFNKGWPGFSIFLLVSFIIGLFFFNPIDALWRAAILALVELLSPRGTDNLTLILASMIIAKH